MALQFDENVNPIVGHPTSDVGSPVEYRCEGCKRHVYVSRPLLRHAMEFGANAGRRNAIVCATCAQPWLDQIVLNGGRLVGTPGAIERDGLAMLDEANRRVAERN